MSNIQQFEKALSFEFPIEIADKVMQRMQQVYGADFDKKYGAIEPNELLTTVCITLNGITPKQLENGLNRMLLEKWCPSLSEFRNLCLDWWTADQAWAKSLQFENDNKVKITKLAKCALDEVRFILEVEGQKAAARAFKDIYKSYLIKAIDQKRTQEFYIPEKPKKSIAEQSSSNKRGVPCPADCAQLIRSTHKRVTL